jgi:hypothetical protein
LKTLRFLMLTVVIAVAAHADFSYITVSKTAAGERTSKHYVKGQKLITEDGDRVTVMDLDAQTMTTINKAQKTYSVRPFSEFLNPSATAGMNVNADIKKTGQRKNINGFDAEEMLVTMQMDSPQAKQPMKMQMEMHFWVASDVPGIEEMRAFYEKNADRLPWAALAQGNASLGEIQRKMAAMHGVPVLTTMKMKSAQQTPEMEQKMAAMRTQMEAMKAQGGAQAAMADKVLAQMGGASSSTFDATNESSGFSARPVPDSVFAIPAGYQQIAK